MLQNFTSSILALQLVALRYVTFCQPTGFCAWTSADDMIKLILVVLLLKTLDFVP